MWSQIVVTLIILIAATYAIQLFLPRARGGARRTSLRWDIAPVFGFFGVVLLALSFAEALRRTLIEAWLIGLACGLVLGLFLWIALGARANDLTRPRGSALVATIRALRAFGLPVLFALIGVYLAVRFVGALVEVFIAGLLGALIIALAVWLFLTSAQTKTGQSQ
ncbi:MAG: hypothetical protein L0Y55_12435 [Anaerolineales bacterium]|nr:hypothetical protein [Anaerolineales bacterium]